MFNPNQINDYAYEKALEEHWDCPEAMIDEWPDDLYDECGFDPYEGCYTYDC